MCRTAGVWFLRHRNQNKVNDLTMDLAGDPAVPRRASTIPGNRSWWTIHSMICVLIYLPQNQSTTINFGFKIDHIRWEQTVFTTIKKTRVNSLYSVLAGAQYSRRRGTLRISRSSLYIYIYKTLHKLSSPRNPSGAASTKPRISRNWFQPSYCTYSFIIDSVIILTQEPILIWCFIPED